jgi:hypothetical protein
MPMYRNPSMRPRELIWVPIDTTSCFGFLRPPPLGRVHFSFSRFYIPLYEKLREERLVLDELDAVLSTLPHRHPSYGRCQYLYTLNDTFIVNFGGIKRTLTALTEQGMEELIFRVTGPFHEMRGGSRFTPYTGAYTNHDLSILLD